MNKKERDKQESREALLKILKDGDTVWAVTRHRAKASGARWLDFYLFRFDKGTKQPVKLTLTYHIAKAFGYRYDKRRESLYMPYINMDPAFEVVYRTSRALFPKEHSGKGRRCEALQLEYV
jgi:hypothetical protein